MASHTWSILFTPRQWRWAVRLHTRRGAGSTSLRDSSRLGQWQLVCNRLPSECRKYTGPGRVRRHCPLFFCQAAAGCGWTAQACTTHTHTHSICNTKGSLILIAGDRKASKRVKKVDQTKVLESGAWGEVPCNSRKAMQSSCTRLCSVFRSIFNDASYGP